MSDKPTLKIQALESGGISADGREGFLDVRIGDDAIRLAFDLMQLRQAGVALLAIGDAAQRAAGIGGLSNFIRAEAADAGQIEGEPERCALSLRLEGGSTLTVALPKTAVPALAGALEGLASAPDYLPSPTGTPSRH